MKSLFVKLLNVILIAGLILGYNAVLEIRDKDDKIAKLSAELESSKLLVSSMVKAAEEKKEEDEGPYVNGTYSGSAQGFGGVIELDVIIEKGYITDVIINSAEAEDGAYLAMAQDIIPKILEAQTADVDTISGATFSSTGIKNAVSEAINKAAR